MDGVTLVRQTETGDAEYRIKDLNFAAPPNPLDLSPDDTAQQRIDKIATCYANAANARAAYNRPNEVLLAPANRTDLLFQAPLLEADESFAVYTLVAQFDILHNENYEKGLRQRVGSGNNNLPNWPGDSIVALIVVSGDPVDGGPIDLSALALPPVPDYLLPITNEELQVNNSAEADARGIELGSYRTRTVTYSGWGNADFPVINVPRTFVSSSPERRNLVYGPINPGDSRMVLLPPNIRTMAIDGRKFDPNDPEHPRMWLGSAEEWAVYNNSVSLWHDTLDSDWSGHVPGQAVNRSTAQAQGLDFISTTTVNHPFHIHTNPFRLSRHEVTLADGSLVNILDEPRWQDVVWLPRNRGRVVFRSRFPDYVEYVNHCHILLHEDNGKMQLVEVVAAASNSNYVPRDQVSEPGMDPEQITMIYQRASLDQVFTQNASFVDPNPATASVSGFQTQALKSASFMKVLVLTAVKSTVAALPPVAHHKQPIQQGNHQQGQNRGKAEAPHNSCGDRPPGIKDFPASPVAKENKPATSASDVIKIGTTRRRAAYKIAWSERHAGLQPIVGGGNQHGWRH
ncbi:MAG: multicopper oxidase domain-containing protein [Candidatus Competibacteraceae bacterium]